METKTASSQKTKWTLDPAHSELQFKVRHLMITNVRGEFRNFDAEVHGDEFTDARVKATIDASSIFTNNGDRDAHLKSADFFDVEKFKEITFISTSIEKKDEVHYKVRGLLTIKGVPKEIVLDVEYGGIAKDPWGNEKAGFSFTCKFNRKDWGLNWNAALETGGVLVSDEVVINGEVQFVRKSA